MQENKQRDQKRRGFFMKKLNNKGFSLIELIIVIAIMAVLMGALAPAMLKFVNKSKVRADEATAETIRNAVNAALADPDISTAITSAASVGQTEYKFAPGTGLTWSAGGANVSSFVDDVQGTVKKEEVKMKQGDKTHFLVTITSLGSVTVVPTK